MLTDEQMFSAKSFLEIYKDAFRCIEQTAEKQAGLDNYRNFYAKLYESQDKNQITFDDKGDLKISANFRQNYYLNLSRYVNNVLGDTLKPATTYEELSASIDKSIEDIKARLNKVRSS